MRRTMLAAAVAFVAGGAVCGAVLANAQPAAAPPNMVVDNAPDGHGPMHRMWGAGRHGPGPRTFALVYRQPDRQLTPADVGKIAEAFLLWQGNHTWKVVDVAATAQGPIAFAVATAEGSVIARFTMDPHTGRVTRTG